MVVYYYRNVSVVIFMYDIIREGLFRVLEIWLQEYDYYGFIEIDGEGCLVSKFMIGNKCDFIYERIINLNEVRKFADFYNMLMWEILIKNDEELEIIEFIFIIFVYKFVKFKIFMDRLFRYISEDFNS